MDYAARLQDEIWHLKRGAPLLDQEGLDEREGSVRALFEPHEKAAEVARAYIAAYPKTEADYERIARNYLADDERKRSTTMAAKKQPTRTINGGKGPNPKDPNAGVINSTGGQVKGPGRGKK